VIYSYRVYGLNCISDAPIPGLWPGEFPRSEADICLQIGVGPPQWVERVLSLPASQIHRKPLARGFVESMPSVTVFGRNAAFELAYSDGTRFVADGAAKRLWGACSPPSYGDDLAVYLRGPALGFTLRLRGITCLHASAVCVRGGAVLFCGPSEAGKSTIAAALSLRRSTVLCDDIAALSIRNAALHVEAGYPRICLWPDAVRGVLGSRNALPQLTPTWEKCFLSLDGTIANFEPQGRPLSVIYVLAERTEADSPRIEEITPRQALLELVQNTYMNWLLDKEQRAREFEVLSNLVTRVPVRRIVPHIDPARIAALCDLIVLDSQSLRNRLDARSVVSSR
jgi:hypothetical protein